MTLVNAETGEVVEAEVLPEGASPPELFRVANDEHKRAVEAGEEFLLHAYRAGEALLLAKAQYPHGDWLPALEANFHAGVRQGQKYMRVAAKTNPTSLLEAGSIDKALDAVATRAESNASQVTTNSGDNEWFTPAPYIEAARAVMGGIDLDPASDPAANKVVRASRIYTVDDDGLTQPWVGRVWMNPPYASRLIRPFCEHLAEQYKTGEVKTAVALVNSATETGWYHTLASVAASMCFPSRRVRFWHPDKPGDAGALQGQTVFYLGDRTRAFREAFSEFGFTVWL